MEIQEETVEKAAILKLTEEYRSKGYEIFAHPSPEDLPDFLKNYRPDMIVKGQHEAVVIAVKSRYSRYSSPQQNLQGLAQVVEQHPGWRFELVMANPPNIAYPPNGERSLYRSEIQAKLPGARQLAAHHPESALLYAWSLVEAVLRLVADHEGLTLQRLDGIYLVKQLVFEGIISRHEYQLLMDSLSLRNAIAHGFKTSAMPQGLMDDLMALAEQLLNTLGEENPAEKSR
jgi:hypothetical protein